MNEELISHLDEAKAFKKELKSSATQYPGKVRFYEELREEERESIIRAARNMNYDGSAFGEHNIVERLQRVFGIRKRLATWFFEAGEAEAENRSEAESRSTSLPSCREGC